MIATICLTQFRNAGGIVGYVVTVLLMKQAYDCRFDPNGDFAHCTSQEICEATRVGAFVEYQIDKTSPNYFENWFHEMDLLCFPSSKIMAFGTVWCLSAGVTGVVCSNLAERVGRWKTIVFW